MMACEKNSGYKNLVCVASGKGGVGNQQLLSIWPPFVLGSV